MLIATLVLAATTAARASVADNAVRTSIAGIDVIAYPTGVKNVVTFRGSIPAGDSLAPEHNIAIPTLVISGQNDLVLGQGPRLAQALGQGKYVEVPGADHFSPGSLV